MCLAYNSNILHNPEQWTQGHKCPKGSIGTDFQGNYGYDLNEAKRQCASGCDAREDCLFADLYYTSSKQTCYLKGGNCGNWPSNTHSSYHLYQKGNKI